MNVELKPSEALALLSAAAYHHNKLQKAFLNRKTPSAPKAMELGALRMAIQTLKAAYEADAMDRKAELKAQLQREIEGQPGPEKLSKMFPLGES